MRETLNFDFDWKFYKGELDAEKSLSHSESYSASKAEGGIGTTGKFFDDSLWEKVTLPHDYMFSSPPEPDANLSDGFRPRSKAWYRKSFVLDEKYKDKTVILSFEGIAGSADIYVNGTLVYTSVSNYCEINIDITDKIYFGIIPNIVSVHIKDEIVNSWWYDGEGIYRHTKLYIKDSLHIKQNGIYVNPVLKGDKWEINYSVEVANNLDTTECFDLTANLYYKGELCNTASSKGEVCDYGENTICFKSFIDVVKLWEPSEPNLYTAEIILSKNKIQLDNDSVNIGFRTFYMDKEKGFVLNGKPLKIYGVCCHQDHAGVGVAVPDSIADYRIRKLKEMGVNAYRCAHSMHSKEILDACDRHGLIVFDENRSFNTSDEILRQLENMVKRDRNHPSVMFYSMFNEEPIQSSENGRKAFKKMKSFVKRLDDTRIITCAINGDGLGAGEEADVIGINYCLPNMDKILKIHAEIPVIGSENNSSLATRGCYKKSDKNECVDIDCETVAWGNSAREMSGFINQHPFFAGIFIWTGFDYRGEPTPYKWPSISSQFGCLDTCGFEKNLFYFNKAYFKNEPFMHILPHWNHDEGEIVKMMTVTNCQEVELYLNGKSLGRKLSSPETQLEWEVPFERGIVSATGYINGKIEATKEIKTADMPYKVKLTADRNYIIADGQDTVPVKVELVDVEGNHIYTAQNKIYFETEGECFVKGVGNGDPNCHESDVLPERSLFNGLCQVLVSVKRDGNRATLRAKCDGVLSDEISFEVKENNQNYADGYNDICINQLEILTTSFKEKPSPEYYIPENDQNSCCKINLSPDQYQSWLNKDWWLIRTNILPNSLKTKLIIQNARAAEMEIYCEGNKLFQGENINGQVEFVVDFSSIEKKEIRFLVKGISDKNNGFKGYIYSKLR